MHDQRHREPEPQWPREIIRVHRTPARLSLHFPALRGWRAARRLALTGAALLAASLYAAVAYMPGGQADAGVLLTLALTAAVVYPVMLLGAVFVLIAFYAAASSFTVEVDANTLRRADRVLGCKVSHRSIPSASITTFKVEAAAAARGLGGSTTYRVAALTRAGESALVIAEGLPDEQLCGELRNLIEYYARQGRIDIERNES